MEIDIETVPISELENYILGKYDLDTRRWALYRLLHEDTEVAYKRGFRDCKEIYHGKD